MSEAVVVEDLDVQPDTQINELGAKRLAMEVLAQVLQDLTKPKAVGSWESPDRIIAEAKLFCLGETPEWNDSLGFWCALAGVHSDLIKRRATEILQNKEAA